MRKEDVPQDVGITEGLKEVCYAVDDDGRYVLVPSAGWEPKNIANHQAWQRIEQQLDDIARQVRDGRKSPVAYFMAKNLMDVGLLAQYVGIARWRVKRHLKPKVFQRLPRQILEKYAVVFGIAIDELSTEGIEAGGLLK